MHSTHHDQQEIRVSSWNELNDALFAESWQERLGRFRSNSAYRGMSTSDFTLATSLKRLGGQSGDLEDYMLRAFRKYARRHFLPEDSVWNWLALAQHHGLATRLLDWTYSPFVAMHFLTANDQCFDRDGVIWSIDFGRTNALLPRKLQRILEEEGSSVFTAEMLTRAAGTLSQLDALSDEPFVLFFEPPSLDERIINQYALFSLLSDPRTDLDRWLVGHPEAYRLIIVPAELKREIRDKLDQSNVTERVLFPGLDGLSRWLNRYYTPRTDTCPEDHAG